MALTLWALERLLTAAELLLERRERTMLERLDRSLGLAEDRRGLAVREVEHELQRQHLLLLPRELVDQLEHRLAPDRLERALLRRRRVVDGRLRHLLLRLPAAVGAGGGHRPGVGGPGKPPPKRGGLAPRAGGRPEQP